MSKGERKKIKGYGQKYIIEMRRFYKGKWWKTIVNWPKYKSKQRSFNII